MSCYVPYCVSGIPYFPVLVQCGFQEEQGGGIVDCIQTINMSGINELLVSQRYGSAGAMMSDKHHARPESLRELEELLALPSQTLSAVEVDSRFQHLCKVIQKYRDTFSSRRVGEERDEEEREENNPFQELHVQLQKAKDRFEARMAVANGGNSKKLECGCRTLFKRTTWSGSKRNLDVNPFQELRDALRMARRHFIPLIDQYVSSRNSTQRTHKNNIDETLGLRGEAREGSGAHCCEPSYHGAADAKNCESTIQSTSLLMDKDYHDLKPWPISIGCNREDTLSSQKAKTIGGSGQISRADSAADCCRTTMAVNVTDECSKSCLPLNLCNCNKISSGAATASSIR